MTGQTKRLLGAVCIVVAVIVATNYFHVTEYLTLTYLHANMHMLQMFVKRQYSFAVIVYSVSFVLATACSIPGSSIFTTAAGLLFGWAGLLYVVCSATLGATLLFLMSRYFIGSWVQYKYADQLAGFNNEMEKHGHHYLLVIRLIALLPFCLVNMLSGLTLISLVRFVLTTMVGLVPVSAVYIFAGKQLGALANPHDFLSPSIVIAFAAFVFFKIALAPAVFKIANRIRILIVNKKREQHRAVRSTYVVAPIVALKKSADKDLSLH